MLVGDAAGEMGDIFRRADLGRHDGFYLSRIWHCGKFGRGRSSSNTAGALRLFHYRCCRDRGLLVTIKLIVEY